MPIREKANLAVTVCDGEEQVLGHASFFDHPVGNLVDITEWETFVQKHFGAGKCTVCVCMCYTFMTSNLRAPTGETHAGPILCVLCRL